MKDGYVNILRCDSRRRVGARAGVPPGRRDSQNMAAKNRKALIAPGEAMLSARVDRALHKTVARPHCWFDEIKQNQALLEC